MKLIFSILALLLITVTAISCDSFVLPQDQIYLNEGNKLYDQQKYAEAVDKYTKALELNPQLIKAYLSRGAAYTELGNYDDALKDLGQVIQMDPENTMAYYQRSMTEIFAQKYDESIADCNEVIKLGLENHFVYYNRGVAYARKGNYDFAMADFLKAKSLTDNADFNRRIDGEINQLRTVMGK